MINRFVENQYLELKRELPAGRKLAIEVIAFANTKGGQIIIGYDESNEEIVGVEICQGLEERVANTISDCCTPFVDYSIGYETIEEKHLLIIEVKAGANTPYCLKNTEPTEGVYVRVGSTSRQADQETIARLYRESKNISFDSVKLSTSDELNNQLLKDFFKSRAVRFNAVIPEITEELLEDLGALKETHKTIAGALLFSDNPQRINELNNAYIQAARIRGEEFGNFLDQQNITGCLSQQIEQALLFVQKNTNLAGQVEDLKRIDKPQYSTEIIREIIVNAVIHRDYSISGAATQLAIYDDKITIISPGNLPGTVTPENIMIRQYNRNPIIAKRMFEWGYFDSWGQGINKIVAWSQKEGLKAPEFIDGNDQFALILYSSSVEDKTTLADLIKKYVSKHGKITNRVCQEEFSLSKTQAQVALKKLVNAKILKSKGRGRAVYYEIA